MLFSESRSLSNPQSLLRADFPNHRRLVDVFCPCKVFPFRRDLARLDFKGSNPEAIFQKFGLFTSASVSSSINGEILPPCGAEERQALRPPWEAQVEDGPELKALSAMGRDEFFFSEPPHPVTTPSRLMEGYISLPDLNLPDLSHTSSAFLRFPSWWFPPASIHKFTQPSPTVTLGTHSCRHWLHQ